MQYKNDFECEGYKLALISVNGYYVNLLPMFRVTSAIGSRNDSINAFLRHAIK